MTNCSDNTYYIFYTDTALGAIAIPKSTLDQESLDITLLGKTRLEYGAVFNENLLHLLEHFASSSSNNAIPDVDNTFANLLQNPVVGQLWYNSGNSTVYVCVANNLGGEVPNEWKAINNAFAVAGNSGYVYDGEVLPLPVAADGYAFSEAECVWHISPSYINLDELVIGMNLSAANRLVVAEYTTASGTRKGLVNYIIIGVKNQTLSSYVIDVPCPTPEVTPTISITPSVTPTIGSSPTPTPTVSPTRTATPTPTLTRTPTRTPSVGASVTPTATPAPTPTPTPSTSPAVNPILLGEVTSEYEGIDDSVSVSMYLQFKNDGTWEAYSPAFGVTSGAWLAGGLAEDYEIAAEYSDGFPELLESGAGGAYRVFDITNIPSGTLSKATFYDLGTSRQILAEDDVFAPDATFNAAKITITVRKISNHAIFNTLYLTCYLDGGCFAVGTQLQTSSGHYKKVENVAVGDTLRNFSDPSMIDESLANWQTWTTSSLDNIDIGTSTVTAVRRFTTSNAIKINGVISTLKHVYFVFDGEYKWKHADAITLSDKLVKSNKTLADITEIVNIQEPTEFVAINVENTDTLVVKTPNGYNIFAHNASA